MRRSLPFLVLLLATTACGGPADRDRGGDSQFQSPSNATVSADMVEEEPAASAGQARRVAGGPEINPTAAPGVAFNYRYSFRLAAPRIAEVQERHAAMCEELGIARCRITGMLYRVVNDRDIEAMLALKIEPGAARAFGREGVAAVVRAEGMLTESQISGTDVGSAIRAAGRSLAELTAELERIEARLRAPGTSRGDKGQLEYEAAQLREQIRALRDNRQAQQETLATTPMVFNYGSGDLVPGFAQRPTVKQTMQRAIDNFLDGATLLLIVLVTLLPWLLAGGLIWWIGRLVRRRWFPKRAAVAVEPEAGAET